MSRGLLRRNHYVQAASEPIDLIPRSPQWLSVGVPAFGGDRQFPIHRIDVPRIVGLAGTVPHVASAGRLLVCGGCHYYQPCTIALARTRRPPLSCDHTTCGTAGRDIAPLGGRAVTAEAGNYRIRIHNGLRAPTTSGT